jgi:hypothetical protein
MNKLCGVFVIAIIAGGLLAALGCSRGPELKLIQIPTMVGTPFDDFGPSITTNQYGLNGTWFTVTMTGGDPAGFYSDSPGYDGTGYALHLTGSATCANYGIKLMTTLSGPPYVYPDIRGMTGIRFYAKDTWAGSYVFTVQSTRTPWYDYEYTFAVNSSWTQVNIPFSKLTQQIPDEVTLSTALSEASHFVWRNAACPQEIDLWLDHIEVY